MHTAAYNPYYLDNIFKIMHREVETRIVFFLQDI